MGIIQLISEFFESIFNSSSPEVKKRQALRKLETELKQYRPEIYKNDLLQPNFGEILRVLYEKTRFIGEILSDTICGEDLQRNGKYEMQLLLTGFTGESRRNLESISFEQRKAEVLESDQSMTRLFTEQKHRLEAIAKELNSANFVRIDEIIATLQQLNDICHFNFIPLIQKFDSDFTEINATSEPNFHAAPLDTLAAGLQDLYYLSASLNLNASVARACIALEELRKGEPPSQAMQQQLTEAVCKLSTIFSRLLSPIVLKKLIQLGKHEPAFEPQQATYKVTARQKFLDFTQQQFATDETRIRAEIKDLTIATELKKLFGERALLIVDGYNSETNLHLQQNSVFAFTWLTPMQITKTFLAVFLNESIKTLLNDIVIEGFFSNSSYKTEFSTKVYAVTELDEEMQAFEKSFGRDGENSTASIFGLISDSHKNQDFVKRLGEVVDKVNEKAYQLLQHVTSSVLSLHKDLAELLTDAKKAKPDIVNNIKTLLGSSRNRDNTSALDQQFGLWQMYFEIMKNYVVVKEPEKKA